MSEPKPKVLVTGATGFLGHHVAEHLVASGYEVVALCRDPDSVNAKRLAAAVAVVKGDVLDHDSVKDAAKGCEVVMHCAGKVSRDPEDATAMRDVNVRGTEVTLAAAREAGVRRAVVASTSGTIAISDDADHVATEDDPTPIELINRWPYYRSKLYGEQAALKANDAAFSVIVVNPGLLLGPGDWHGSSTEDVRRALESRPPVVTSGGIAYVDARDAAEGMRLAMEQGKAGERYLLVSCNCTVRTFFDRIARVAGTSGPMFTLPDDDRVRQGTLWLARQARSLFGEDDNVPDEHTLDIASHYWYADASKAERDLGWRPRDPMVTLADTVEDLRERGVVMMAEPS